MIRILTALFVVLSFGAHAQCQFPPVYVNQNLSCDTCICGKDTVWLNNKDTAAVHVINTLVNSQQFTGTTTENQLYSFKIPANTLKVGNVISFVARVSKVNTAGGSDHRVRFGTANSTADPTIAFYTTSAAQNGLQWTRTYLYVKDATTLVVMGTGLSKITDIEIGSFTSVTIDITVDNWMSFTGKLANSGDIYILDRATVWLTPTP